MPVVGAHIIVTGRVQGVGYRYFAERVARRLGLTGTVRNCHDGSVEVAAEGDRNGIESFAEWLKEGPSGARVDHVAVSWLPATGRFTTFEIEV